MDKRAIMNKLDAILDDAKAAVSDPEDFEGKLSAFRDKSKAAKSKKDKGKKKQKT